jgi:acyl-CoA synthetase (AMP-forming)/AMP-acid ligase II
MNIGLIPQKWARQTPDRVAIIDSTTEQQINFRDLDKRVRQLANTLLSLGLHKCDRVAALSQNSIEYVTIYFACARIGLVVQPMNWRLSAPELAKIIGNGEPKVFITQGQFAKVANDLAEMVDSVEHWLEYGDGGNGSY